MDSELDTLLRVPRGNPNLAPLEFELGEINSIEKRKVEISYANRETAPELMQIFNTAYCAITRMMALVQFEYSQAKKNAEKRKSVIILNVVPEELTRRNLKDTSINVNAILNSDLQYEALMDKVHALETAYAILKGRAKGFEMSYQSAKKIFDITNTNLGLSHEQLSGGLETNIVIGKPRY